MTAAWRTMESAPYTGAPVLLRLTRALHSNDVVRFVPWTEIGVVIGWWDRGWKGCFMEDGLADTHGNGWAEYQDLPDAAVAGWMSLPIV